MRKVTLLLAAILMAVVAKAVTPPTGAAVETWYANFTMHTPQGDEKISEPMEVAISGQDIYFNLLNPITGATWVKGTNNGGMVTFASGQFIGSYNGSVYMMGQNEQGVCDVTFTYHSDYGVFVQDEMYLVLSASKTTIDAWAYYTGMMVTRDPYTDDPRNRAEDWTLTGRNVNPNNEEQYESLDERVKVAIEGDSIFIQGLSAYDPSAWLAGTISDSIATFKKNQPAGVYGGKQLYFIGYAGESDIDIEFDYLSSLEMLVAKSYILCATADHNTYQILTDVVLKKKGDDPQPDEPLVELPAGATPIDYTFKATSILYNPDGSLAGMQPVEMPVKVAFAGSKEVYVQGLCDFMPEAWVKGTVDTDEVTFARGQFMGRSVYPVYFMGRIFNEMSDVVFTLSNNRVLRSGSYYVVINASKSEFMPYSVYAGVTMERNTSGIDAPAADGTAEIYTDLQGRRTGKSARGLLIKRQIDADGSIKTVKIVK
jgi:hypothetical protein